MRSFEWKLFQRWPSRSTLCQRKPAPVLDPCSKAATPVQAALPQPPQYIHRRHHHPSWTGMCRRQTRECSIAVCVLRPWCLGVKQRIQNRREAPESAVLMNLKRQGGEIIARPRADSCSIQVPSTSKAEQALRLPTHATLPCSGGGPISRHR